jgi:hypothetical protein
MVFGKKPFEGQNEKELFYNISKGFFKFPEQEVNQKLKNLINQLLQVDP